MGKSKEIKKVVAERNFKKIKKKKLKNNQSGYDTFLIFLILYYK